MYVKKNMKLWSYYILTILHRLKVIWVLFFVTYSFSILSRLIDEDKRRWLLYFLTQHHYYYHHHHHRSRASRERWDPTLAGHSANHLHQTKARDGEQLLLLHSSISSSSSSCFGAAFSRFLCDSLLPPGWHCHCIRFEILNCAALKLTSRQRNV